MHIPAHTTCRNCGQCCGVIPASKAELTAIQQFVKDHPHIKQRLASVGDEPLQCPFRDSEAEKCLIYPVRPVVCRLMGVCNGMKCEHGNSADIDGSVFLQGGNLDDYIILNTINWR
jgi:Fe-S-cluster containining protein